MKNSVIYKLLPLLVWFGLSVLPLWAGAQTTDSSEGDLIYKQAGIYVAADKFDSAILFYEKAAKEYLKEEDLEMYAESRTQLMIWNYNFSRFDLIERIAKHLLAVSDTASKPLPKYRAYAHKYIGLVTESREGDYNQALLHYHDGLKELITALGLEDLKVELNKDVGIVHLILGTVDSADFYFQIALDQQLTAYQPPVAPEQAVKLASTYRLMGTRHTLYSNFKQAQAFYKKSLDLLESVENDISVELDKSNIFSNLGSTFDNEGLADSAIHYFQLQKKIISKLTQNQRVGEIYVNLTTAYIKKRNYDSSLYYAQKSLEIQEAALSSDHPELAYIYVSLGDISVMSQGSLENAKDYYQKAYDIRETALGENHFLTAEALRRLAIVYKHQGLPDKSLRLQNEALKKLEGASDQNINSVLIATIERGSLEQDLKLWEASLGSFQTVIDRASEAEIKNPEILVKALVELAESQMKLQNFDQAEENLVQAENIMRDGFSENHHTFADIWNLRAQKSFQENDLSQSLIHSEKGLKVIFPARDSDKSDKFGSINDAKFYLTLTSFYSSTHYKMYKLSGELTWLKKSIEQGEEMVSFLSWMLPLQSNHQDRLFISNNWQKIYHDLFSAISELITHENTQNNKERLYTQYEKSKAISLLFKSNEQAEYAGSKLPLALLAQENTLKTDLAYYTQLVNQAEIPSSVDSAVLAYAQQRLLTIKLDYKNLMSTIERDFNEYYRFYYDVSTIPVAELEAKLTEEQVVIEYIITDEKLITLCITSDGLHVNSAVIPSNLFDHINQSKLKVLNKSELKVSGRKLYEFLLKPIEHLLVGKEELIIVPYNQLWNVNFDLLLTEEADSDNLKGWPFLIKKYAIGYANSATLLFHENSNVPDPKGQLLAYSYGDEIKSEEAPGLRNTKASLPGTAREIQTLKSVIKGDYYYSDSATESSFKKNAPNYKILHLALHGEVNHKKPIQSRLQFLPSQSDSTEDGNLYVFELYSMKLGAQLAVLSACDTGSGEIVSGEGIMSIGRAFKYAGVNSLLVSRSEISDPITPIIMKSFYSHLLEGKNKAEALRLAKLEFLESSDNIFSNPFYWANFFILGNTEVIRFDNGITYPQWLWLAIFIIILLVIYQLKQRRKTT